jgi:tyrosyl-tRNA synthetase
MGKQIGEQEKTSRLLGDTVGILDLLINTGLAPNRKQAQRLVEQGGVRINDERITNREQRIKPEDGMIIKAGRSYVRIID